jgi:acetyl-CoA carboxylase biotin carboxyl carrier protein
MPIDTSEIERLAKILEHSGIASIEIEENGQSLKLVMEDTEPRVRPASLVPIALPGDAAVIVKADVAGIFVAAHPWRAKPFVEPGQCIEAGAVVGLVKIGLLYAPVLSPATGFVDAIIAETGATVGYGSPIVSVQATA